MASVRTFLGEDLKKKKATPATKKAVKKALRDLKKSVERLEKLVKNRK